MTSLHVPASSRAHGRALGIHPICFQVGTPRLEVIESLSKSQVIDFDDFRLGPRSVLPTSEASSMITLLEHSKVILLTTQCAYTVAGSPRPRRPVQPERRTR
jgi:hypothetical protein